MLRLLVSIILIIKVYSFGIHHFKHNFKTISESNYRIFANNDNEPLNKYSRTITEPPKQGASQAMLYATGLTPDTIKLPQVGICSVWFEGNPCNMHLLDLGGDVKLSKPTSEYCEL